MIALSTEFDHFAVEFFAVSSYTSINEVLPLRGERMSPKLSTENHVHGQVVDTVTCTVKLKIPDTLAHRLDSMLPAVELCIKRMLGDRSLSSSKYYPELPCIISKSLIAKYQRNPKLKVVTNVVLPICGDKGRQIKWDGSWLRIPVIFKRETIPFAPDRAPVRDEEGRVNLSGEFFHREGEWYLALSYKTAAIAEFKPAGMIGVDRNSVGAIATLADSTNGKVLHLGFNPAATKACWRGRKKNLHIHPVRSPVKTLHALYV